MTADASTPISRCAGCRATPPAGAGFCVSCGRPLEAATGPEGGDADGVALPVDNAEGAVSPAGGDQRATSESAVSRGSDRSRNVVGVGLAVVALGLAVVLIRPDGGSGDDDAGNVEPPPPSSVPGDEVVQPDGGGGGRGGPFLGSVVGWSLLATAHQGTTVIDLDRSTAEETTIEGQPLAVIGDRFVLDRSGLVVSVPVADPTAPAIELSSNVVRVREVDERRGWFATVDVPGQSLAWNLIDVTTGESEQTVTSQWHDSEHPELSTTLAGGVWARFGDHDVQVSEGRLLVADQEKALISTCATPDDCRRQWFNRSTWGPIDLPVPVPVNMFSASEILGSRVLVHRRWNTPRFHDLARDRDIDPPVGEFSTQYAISPDGRYLEVGSGKDSMWIIDLDSGRRWDLAPLIDDSDPGRYIESVLFVETAALTAQS